MILNIYFILKNDFMHRGLINCYTSDPCRLSWLILYQQNLFKVIRNDQCSTAGVSFANADKDLFRGCPVYASII